jgi:hypothetical protein
MSYMFDTSIYGNGFGDTIEEQQQPVYNRPRTSLIAHGWTDDLRDAFDPEKNGFNDALDPRRNGFNDFWTDFGKGFQAGFGDTFKWLGKAALDVGAFIRNTLLGTIGLDGNSWTLYLLIGVGLIIVVGFGEAYITRR